MKNMTPRQVEMRAIRILDRLARREFREDSLVEIKRALPEDYKVARRIAAHCNASRGDTILWIIGADEKEGVVGWSAPDFADFLPRIWSFFDGCAPDCTEVALDYGGIPCTALAFSANRTPYLVKNPSFGTGGVIEREIPWRDGTRVRTATRDEVIRLLLDRSVAPDIEFFRGEISQSQFIDASKAPEAGMIPLVVHIEFYAMPRDDQPVIIPIHRISARLSDHGKEFTTDQLRGIVFWSEEGQRRDSRARAERSRTGGPVFPLPPPDDSVNCTGTEVIISRPAHVHLYAEFMFSESSWEEWDQFEFETTLRIGVDQIPLMIADNTLRKATKG
jgi:hypothetical protein